MRLPLLAVLICFVQVGTPLFGQAAPGGISTATVRVTAPDRIGDPEEAVYRITPADGVELFVPPEGPVRRTGQTFVLPITFRIPASTSPGPFQAADVEILGRGGFRASGQLVVEVAEAPGLTIELPDPPAEIPIGRDTPLRYRVSNTGNTPLRGEIGLGGAESWTPDARSPPFDLPPGSSASGSLVVHPPRETGPGELRVLVFTASAAAVREQARVPVRAVPSGGESGLVTLPGFIAIGGSHDVHGEWGPAVALRAAGEAWAGARVQLDLQNTPGSRSHLMRPLISTNRSRLSVRTLTTMAALGDVYLLPDHRLTQSFHGDGFSAERTGPSWGGALLFAVQPQTGPLEGRYGRTLHAALRKPTSVGIFGVSVSQRTRPEVEGTRSATLATADYRLVETRTHRLTTSAGLASTGGAAGEPGVRPVASAEYDLNSASTNVSARARHTTAEPGSRGELPSNYYLRAVQTLLPDLQALGWVFATRVSSVPLSPPVAHWRRGGALGVRAQRHRASVTLTGQTELERLESGHGLGRDWLGGSAGYRVGRARVTAAGEVGRSTSGGEMQPYTAVRAGLTAPVGGGTVWLGAARGGHLPGMDRGVRLEAGADTEVQRLRLMVNGSSEPGSRGRDWRLATRVQAPLTDRLAILVGAEAARWGGMSRPARFSIAISHALNVPLPMRRGVSARGVVFEDLNGNRRRDPGEPGVPGVRLRLGWVSASAGEDGSYSIRSSSESGSPLEIDPLSLPEGMAMAQGVSLAPEGRIDVPLVRLGGVALRFFDDRDGDGRRDSAEPPIEGASVVVRGEGGLVREAVTDAAGLVRLVDLPPGVYELVVSRDATMRVLRLEPTELPLRVEPGDGTERVIGIRLPRREIRFDTGAPSH